MSKETASTFAKHDMMFNMGPIHPATHGVLRLLVETEGERVVGLTPQVGYIHRSLEKIAENRTYHQVVPFTDRTMDYACSIMNNWVYCRAAEDLLGVTVPERAEYIRVIVGELNRIASHLIALGSMGNDVGATTFFLWCMVDRERILKLLESVTGARLTYCFMRIGGVARDLPENFAGEATDTIAQLRSNFTRYLDLFINSYIWMKRSKGIGVLGSADAVRLGAAGPVLRGSNVQWDLRKDFPYSVYNKFDFTIPTGDNGDSWNRIKVRFDELEQSARIIEQALQQIPEGPCIAEGVARLPAPPPGEAYARIESPRGELGCYLVSDGSHKPYRMKIRPPAFYHIRMLPQLCVGAMIADLVTIIATLDPVMGECDR